MRQLLKSVKCLLIALAVSSCGSSDTAASNAVSEHSALDVAQSAQEIPVTVLLQSQQCHIPEAHLKILDAQAYEKIRQKLQGFDLGPTPLAQRPVISGTTSPTKLASSELKEDTLTILVAWGSKPTAAYQLSLASDYAQLQEGVLNLPIVFIEPEAGMFTAQVITSPCLVIQAAVTDDTVNTINAGNLTFSLNVH